MEASSIWSSLYLLNPILIAFVLCMIYSAMAPSGVLRGLYNVTALIASLYLALAACCALCESSGDFSERFKSADYFGSMLVVDKTACFSALFLGIAAFVFFTMAPRYLERKAMHSGEFYLLSLVSLAGMLLTVSTRHYTGLILGIETMSIPLYFLIAMDRRSNEGRMAALKYLILGGVGSAILIYGISLIYGATGTLTYTSQYIEQYELLFYVGSVFLFAGFLFKTGAFPFHAWVPDVYGAAPTPLTGFMATAVKLSAVIAMYNLFLPIIDKPLIKSILPVLAVLTMTVGNLMALKHKNPKQVLAYSSIAHTGYILVGFAAGFHNGSSGILFYIAVYTLMTLGAFAVLSSVPSDDPKYLQGLIKRKPALAIFFAVSILSLAGVPPFGGFIGKFIVFLGAWEEHKILVMIAIANSLIALGYYIPLLRWVLFEEPDEEADHTSNSIYLYVACVICTVGVIYTGLMPGDLSDLIQSVILR